MGREVRRVPPNWQHPKSAKHDDGRDQPMHDQRFDEKFAEWLADFDRIRAGGMTDDEREYYPRGLADWLQDEGLPPDPAYYRPWRDEEATWFQVWETVSEGCPVTPPFATREELIDYLVEHGDFWDQKRFEEKNWFMLPERKLGWNRDAATRFVNAGWAPSLVVADGVVYSPRDGAFP